MDNYSIWAEEVLKKIKIKMDWVCENNKTKIPYTTDIDGKYDDRSAEDIDWNIDDGINWWTNGFWSGIMWLLYKDTNNPKYAEIAKIGEEKIEKCFMEFHGLHHDVGFMFLPTSVANYKLTGDLKAKKNALLAANLLAGRFNIKGKFIRAWNDLQETDTRGWAIIDCLFNISLLFWASKESKDPRFKHIAIEHANTVMENFVRADGSVKHIVEFNPETGEMKKNYGGQGFSDTSSWSRGQGWAVYGFVNCYNNTKNEIYLNTAKKIAHYCIANIPENGLIPVDFRQPPNIDWEDSCGACVIAGGLIEISKVVEKNEKDIYIRAAFKILKTITDHRANWSKECEAIVQNCTAAYHDKKHHFTMIYADYYYIEAIYKLIGQENFIW